MASTALPEVKGTTETLKKYGDVLRNKLANTLAYSPSLVGDKFTNDIAQTLALIQIADNLERLNWKWMHADKLQPTNEGRRV